MLKGQELRRSVPRSMDVKDISPFLNDMMKNSEPWKAIKLVVLGHGRIGKTTMLQILKRLISTNQGYKVESRE